MKHTMYTKNFTAWAWFHFQKQAHVEVIDVDVIYVDGERLMQATFYFTNEAAS